jgi:class 3 adenylate cyclase/CheY-like chemotaxis protein
MSTVADATPSSGPDPPVDRREETAAPRQKVLVVDDTPQNIRLLEAILLPRGYAVLTATSGQDALRLVSEQRPDIILLDIVMPGMDGYEVCRRVRDDPATHLLPMVMVTASGDQEKVKALEVGADDFISKPVNQAELLARVKSLLRIKAYHDTIEAQAAELADWNRTLEQRVHQQVEELERVGRLRRYLSPQLAEAIAAGDQQVLESHRRQIAVVFCDLRGFSAFSEQAEPEEVMSVLREYHDALGALVVEFEATVGHFAGDGLMVYFNDPVPCPDPPARAVRLACAMRKQVGALIESWRRHGHDLGFGVGVSFGYATLGQIGFEGRFDYDAIGSVVNLASRLCDEAEAGQVLINQRVYAAIEELVDVERLPDFTLKGFQRPIPAYNVVTLRDPA